VAPIRSSVQFDQNASNVNSMVISSIGENTDAQLAGQRNALDEQRITEARFRAVSDALPLGIFVSDEVGDCIYTNAVYQQISGLSFDQALGTHWYSAIHSEDIDRVMAEWEVAKLDKSVFHTDARFSRVDGSFVWARINVAAMHDGNVMLGYVQTVENITDRKSSEQGLSKAEEALFEEMERAQVTLNSIGDAVLTTDLQCNVTYLNSAAESITGWRRDEALGQPLTEVFNIMDATTRESAVNPARLAIDKDRAVELDANCVIVRRDGSESAIEDSSAPIHNRSGQVIGAVIVFRDVSNARAMADKMSHLALHDALTGLPNRLLLTERLSQAIGMARRNSKQLALLYIDLDHFKRVNDSLGHVAGDELLVLVARRLVECVRSTDTVCRQGGDEFVILLPEIEQAQDVTQVAEKLLAALKLPQLVAEKQLNVTMSIGISVYPDDGDTVDSLMINADNAMYDAKSGGRNNYRFFKADLNAAKQN